MDGTLLDDQKRISPENANWIARAGQNGVTVMLTTGRGIQNIRPYVEELQLRSPLVAVNGGEVWKAPGEVHKRIPLHHELIRKMREKALETGVWYWAYTTEGIMNRDSWIDKPWEEQIWLKFGYSSKDERLLKEIGEWLGTIPDIEVTNSHWSNLEIGPIGITKASGVEEVCRMLGIGLHECVAIGDGDNDISMLRACGLGVAMANAPDDVKQHADRTTASNTEDGVAEALKYVLTCNGVAVGLLLDSFSDSK